MDPIKQLRADLGRNQWVIDRQVEGLTHDDTLIQPPFRGNCLNWVLGHIVVHRGLMVKALGGEDPVSEALRRRYGNDSEPVLGAADAQQSLEQLLDEMKRLREGIEQRLEGRTAAELDAVIDVERGTTLGSRLGFLVWHEAYHVGQTELLRQLAGKDDKII